jgi:hypothetical protein
MGFGRRSMSILATAALELSAAHSCDEGRGVPVFAVVDHQAVPEGRESRIAHFVGIAVGQDDARSVPFRDCDVRIIGRMRSQCGLHG